MLKKLLLPVLLISAGFVACNNGTDQNSEVVTEQPEPQAADTTQQKSTTVPATPPGNFRLNPPHGQPGHTCDVPEGAPLSNAPVTANNLPAQVLQAPAPQPINNAAPAAVTPASVTSTPTPAGMNPPHGQPGHRCDIAVGAPLNSKPAPKTTATTEAKPIQPVAAQPTAPGMNPPHGQPGHRCDIAVGAPLNSKPAEKAVVPVVPAGEAVKPDSAKGG